MRGHLGFVSMPSMDANIRTICGLLESPDPVRRHAAAIVLAELAPKDNPVVEALGKALVEASPVLAVHLLDALRAVGTPAVVRHVLPLLDAESMELKLRAVAMVAKAGERVVPEIQRRLEGARSDERLVLVDLLARIHGKTAFGTLLQLLFDPDFEFVKTVCDAVRRHRVDATPKERLALHKSLMGFLGSPRVKGQERVIASCLLLLGTIGQAEARAALLSYAAVKYSPYLRRHALIGLKNLEVEGAAAAAMVRPLVPYLGDADEEVVRHTLDLLARAPSLDSVDWVGLMDSPHASVRGFAVRRMAMQDTPASNKRLITLLGHRDTDVREVAASALSGHPGATRMLLDALGNVSDTEMVWRLAKILKPHSERIDSKTFTRLATLVTDVSPGPCYEAILYVLHNVDPKATGQVLLDTGLAHKKAKRWDQAVDCLRRLVNTEVFNADARYALSVCNLKVSKKDLNPHMRVEDHALRGMQGLLRMDKVALADRLKKDKTLDFADLFYVGFHFTEQAGDEHVFGVALLEHLAKTASKSAEGKAAKNKLKLIHGKGTLRP